MESFSVLLSRARIATGLSYQRIAELVGRSPTTIRNWERAKSTPTDPEVVVALAAVLAVPEHELLSSAGLTVPGEMFADLVPGDLQSPDDLSEDVPVPTASGEIDEVVVEPGVPDNMPEPKRVTPTPPPEEPTPAEPLDEPKVETVADASPTGPQSSQAGRHRQPIPAAPGPIIPSAPTAEPSYLEDDHQLMTYRVRAVLTVVIGIVLLLMFEWGLRGLGTSLKDLLGGIGS